MKKISLFISLGINILIQGQTFSTDIFAISRYNSGDIFFPTNNIKLCKAQFNGNAFNNISVNPVQQILSINALYAYDSHNGIYYIQASDSIIGFNTSNGVVSQRALLNGLSNYSLDFMRFNCADTTIYFLARDNSQSLLLAKIDPITGLKTQISSQPIALNGYNLNGGATIDSYNSIFYFISSSNNQLTGINLNTGNVVSSVSISTPSAGYFDLISFNNSDGNLYGVFRETTSQLLYLAKIDPQNGNVTSISSVSIGSGYIHDSFSSIDEMNDVYYFMSSNGNIVGVSLVNGNVLFNSSQVNNTGGGLVFMQVSSPCTARPRYLGMINNSKEITLRIFPNPTSGNLTISEISLSLIGQKGTITDVNGKQILDFEITQQHHQIDCSSMKKGIYFLRIGEEYQKIMVE